MTIQTRGAKNPLRLASYISARLGLGEAGDAVKLNKQDTAPIRAVELINELFAIDAQARNEKMDHAARHTLRHGKSPTLLDEIRTHIIEQFSSNKRPGLPLYWSIIVACPICCTSVSVSVAQRDRYMPVAVVGGVGKWEAFFVFHFPMPPGSFGQACGRRWRFVAQRRMWAFRVVVGSPAFSQHSHLFE